MKETLFEKAGGCYIQVGDYYLPMLKAPETLQIGRFGRMHYDYITEKPSRMEVIYPTRFAFNY